MSSCLRLLLLTALIASPVRADEALFRERVAPVLRKRCLECHNAQKSRGGLDLSSGEALFRGGDQGAAVVAGQSGKSLIIEQVRGSRPAMPRKGEPLSA